MRVLAAVLALAMFTVLTAATKAEDPQECEGTAFALVRVQLAKAMCA
jgi:hypothetical protein